MYFNCDIKHTTSIAIQNVIKVIYGKFSATKFDCYAGLKKFVCLKKVFDYYSVSYNSVGCV